jgi:antitoxin ParD1/3/4
MQQAERVADIDTRRESCNDLYMPSVSSMNISLTPEHEKFIRESVATGSYATQSEVVREGLRLLQLRQREETEALEVLKAKLKRGIDQADRGEFVNPADVFKRARKIIDNHRRKQA